MATADPPPLTAAEVAAVRARTAYRGVRRLCDEVTALRAEVARQRAAAVAVGHRLADCAEHLGRLSERKDRRST